MSFSCGAMPSRSSKSAGVGSESRLSLPVLKGNFVMRISCLAPRAPTIGNIRGLPS